MTSSSVDYGGPAASTGEGGGNSSPELSLLPPPGEELAIAQATIRAQYQAMEEAGLRFHIASFGSVAPGGSDRLGINFGKDGATWPVVAEVTPASLADSIRPALLGLRLHSIAGVDGRSVRVDGLSLEDGLALVRAVGRPLLLIFESVEQAATRHRLVPAAGAAAGGLSDGGERCPSPQLLAFEGSAADMTIDDRNKKAFGQVDDDDDDDDLDDETEEEEYQDAEEHPYPAGYSHDTDDGAGSSTAGGEEEEEGPDTVLSAAVRDIRVLLNAWLQNVAMMSSLGSIDDGDNCGGPTTTASGRSGSDVAVPTAHVYVYGSCLLFGDVVEDESDIDLLVVVPSLVDRHLHFFGPQPEPPPPSTAAVADHDASSGKPAGDASTAAGIEQQRPNEGAAATGPDQKVLAQLLNADSRVCELTAVRDAYVPCLRFKFNGRPIDLTLATPGLKSPLPGEAAQSRGRGWNSDLPAGLMNETVLQSLSSSGDAATLRSLNGTKQ
jgi:hypothetical protein